MGQTRIEVICGLHQASVAEHGALVKQFHQIPDQQTSRGGRYPLPFILVVIVMGMLFGQYESSGIAEWIELTLERGSASQFLEWPSNYWSIENGLHN